MNEHILEKIIILYDNDCSFCNWCRRLVEKRDKNNKSKFVGIREQAADAFFEKIAVKIDRTNPETIATIRDSKIKYKWRACMEILKFLTWPWQVLGFLGDLLPRFLGDYIYDVASKNRDFLCKIVKC